MGISLKGILKINCELINLTGLLIGTGRGKLEIGELDIEPLFITTMYNIDGNIYIADVPTIPGSSLKGRIRSLLEVAMNMPLWSDGKIVQHYGVRSKKELKEGWCLDPKCPICTYFGRPALQIEILESELKREKDVNVDELIKKLNEYKKYAAPTRLYVSDAIPTVDCLRRIIEEKEGSISVGKEDFLDMKPENRIDRVTSAADPRTIGRIKPGIRFGIDFTICLYYDFDVNNLRNLIMGMELLEDTYLGASGSRGYGRVKFENIVLTLKPIEYYKGETNAVKRYPQKGTYRDLSHLKTELVHIIDDIKRALFR